jgi:hypothetical protein
VEICSHSRTVFSRYLEQYLSNGVINRLNKILRSPHDSDHARQCFVKCEMLLFTSEPSIYATARVIMVSSGAT